MDVQNWDAEWTCMMDQQIDKQHGQAAWTNSMDMQHGHAALT
jgi:hypothetical protein